MNPLLWKREHQLAWIVACMIGAVAGLTYAFSRIALNDSEGFTPASFFIIWLQHPTWYWYWALMGAVIAGLAFYLHRLLKA